MKYSFYAQRGDFKDHDVMIIEGDVILDDTKARILWGDGVVENEFTSLAGYGSKKYNDRWEKVLGEYYL